jgi:hypothetical protein
MANKRAVIDITRLSDIHVPLTSSRDREELVAPTIGPEPASYPSLDVAKDDPLVPYPLQLRLSQVLALRRLKAERGIVPAQLVREFIEVGLKSIR